MQGNMPRANFPTSWLSGMYALVRELQRLQNTTVNQGCFRSAGSVSHGFGIVVVSAQMGSLRSAAPHKSGGDAVAPGISFCCGSVFFGICIRMLIFTIHPYVTKSQKGLFAQGLLGKWYLDMLGRTLPNSGRKPAFFPEHVQTWYRPLILSFGL